MRKKMDESNLRKKTETNVFAEILSKVMPTGQGSIDSPPPPPPPPTPQKMRRGTHTDGTSASVTVSPSLIHTTAIKEFKYAPSKQEPIDDDYEQHDYDEDDNFVEEEAGEYGRENVGPEASPYLMSYVYKGRFLHTQYGVRKDGDMFMIGDPR